MGVPVRDTDGLVWRKSQRCDSAACVEIAFDGEVVLIRSSNDPGRRLTISRREWQAFVRGLRDRADGWSSDALV
jgi:Domain of unknown function (DUF397)